MSFTPFFRLGNYTKEIIACPTFFTSNEEEIFNAKGQYIFEKVVNFEYSNFENLTSKKCLIG